MQSIYPVTPSLKPRSVATQQFYFACFLFIYLFSSNTAIAAEPTTKGYKDVDTPALQQLIKNRKDLIIIDVRMPSELASLGGTIDGGFRNYNLSRGWLELRVGDIVPDKNTPVVAICGIAARSPLAAKTLSEMGYTNVYNYSDGFFKWRDAGLPVRLSDENPGSMLFRKPVKVAEGIWSAIGETAPPTYENSGHNNNLSFIITDDGVIVINAGANYLLAQALHAEIKKLTDKPVKFVTLENGQGHAMLGSNYWQEQGAVVIAHEDTATVMDEHGRGSLERMRNRQRDKSMGTVLSKPDITFTDNYVIELGGQRIELINLGPAHSPGDIVAWLPERKIVVAGDIAFYQRLLTIFEYTDTEAWVDTWQHFKALGAELIVPGHGEPTTFDEVEKNTHGYLTYMRDEVSKLLDAGGTLADAYKIDQSAYAHLDTFDELAKQNAGRIFRAMEFE